MSDSDEDWFKQDITKIAEKVKKKAHKSGNTETALTNVTDNLSNVHFKNFEGKYP